MVRFWAPLACTILHLNAVPFAGEECFEGSETGMKIAGVDAQRLGESVGIELQTEHSLLRLTLCNIVRPRRKA